MKRFFGVMLGAFLISSLISPAQADEKEANAIVDKAIKAMGGEEKLKKAATWKHKGTITINGGDNEFTTKNTAQGLDHSRREFDGDFNGNKFAVVTVFSGDKAWFKFGDMDAQELTDERLSDEKRRVYLQLAPFTLLPLKEKGFKLDTAADEKVDDKPASVVKVACPDGKDFTLFFDKESGLPVKLNARVVGFGQEREEHDDETTFSGYKEFDGVKKPTKALTKRDKEKFMETELTEFKVLEKVEPETFSEPK